MTDPGGVAASGASQGKSSEISASSKMPSLMPEARKWSGF
jgi:hypothetical protein